MVDFFERRLLPRDPYWKPVTDPVQSLVEDLKSVRPGGIIRIYTGEAHPLVYNDPRFLAAAEETKRNNQATITAIAGPVLAVGQDGSNGLLRLKERGTISLLHRLARGTGDHFRVVETDQGYHCYMEFPHYSLAPSERRLTLDFAALTPREAWNFTEDSLSTFDSWAERIRKRPSAAGNGLPLLATEPDLCLLIQAARERELVFDYLSPEEILALPDAGSMLSPFRSA